MDKKLLKSLKGVYPFEIYFLKRAEKSYLKVQNQTLVMS